MLAAAAVIGRSFDVDTVRAASGRGDEETVDGARGARRAAGSCARAATTTTSRHEQLRRLVADETGLARRRLLHGRVADALLGGRPGRRPRRESPGTSASRGATPRRPPPTAAPPSTRGRCSPTPRRSSTCGAALAVGDPEPASLHAAIGDLQTLQGEYGAALASYETAAAHAAPDGVGAIEHRLGQVRHRRGEWALATAHFEAALRGARASPARRARILADLSLSAHDGGDPARAAELAERARALAEQAGDPRALGQAHNLLGALATSGGAAADALEHLGRSLELAEATGRPGRARRRAQQPRAGAPRARRARAGARADPAPRSRCARRQGDRHREAALHNNLADLLHDGRPPRGGDGAAQVRGGDLRRGRRGGGAAAGGVEARALVTAAASSRTPARIAGSASWP